MFIKSWFVDAEDVDDEADADDKGEGDTDETDKGVFKKLDDGTK